MTTLQFNLTEVDGHRSLTVFDATGYSKVVDQGHPYFQAVLEALIEDPQDVEKIAGMIDPEVAIARAVALVSPRLTVDRNGVYLDKIRVNGGAARVLKDRLYSGDPDWERYAKFVLQVEENPSQRAKDFVFGWVEKYGATILPDGRIVGYKGLVHGTDIDGEQTTVSSHSGPNNFIDGVLYGEPDVAYQVPHRVGTVISKRRGDVADTPQACATGLHVGAYNYALTFGEQRLDLSGTDWNRSTFALVAFSPTDVVGGESDWKIRVCRYEVLEFLEKPEDVLAESTSMETPVEVEEPLLTTTAISHDGGPVEDRLNTPDVEKPTLADWVAANPDSDLVRDLNDRNLGHKPLGRKWADITSEASVRRFRNNAGIKVSLKAKVSR